MVAKLHYTTIIGIKQRSPPNMDESSITPLNGLARILVDTESLDSTIAYKTLSEAQKGNTPFECQLINNNILTAKKIAAVAANNFGLPFFDIDNHDRKVLPDIVSESLIRKHNALPLFKRGQQLFIAVSDPSQLSSIQEIQFHTGLQTNCIVVEADKLQKLMAVSLSNKENSVLDDLLGDVDLSELEISIPDANAKSGDVEIEGIDEAPIVRFVNKTLLDAINREASDIHFEPYESNYRIRFRLDGILSEITNPPSSIARRITSRLKVMAQLDISERRIPQDGRFKMNLSRNRSIDFRVSTCPTVNSEKVVMRILDPQNSSLDIEQLGFNAKQKSVFLKAIQQPQGMILVTGPTGSGKTITLYTALALLNTVEKNISTAENPVEIKLSGINQVDINPKTGLTFSATLRSFLRQDPDIIMIGEIRDLETAEIGVKAAQTGHMLLSTLHTNSAIESINRLVNMGISPFNLATSLCVVMAQRLARKLCKKCKIPHQYSAEVLMAEGFCESEINDLELFKATGCEQCHQGYKGRVGLFEVLEITDTINELIISNASPKEIAAQARKNGFINMQESGLDKVRSGITSLEEVNRITKKAL